MLEKFSYLLANSTIKLSKEELISICMSIKLDLTAEYEHKFKVYRESLTEHSKRLTEARKNLADLEYQYNTLLQKYDIMSAQNEALKEEVGKPLKTKPNNKYDKLSKELFGGE